MAQVAPHRPLWRLWGAYLTSGLGQTVAPKAQTALRARCPPCRSGSTGGLTYLERIS